MARGAGEPSAKRAKVDETEEEEDPLVRRREEVVRLLGRASAKGKGNARAKEELLTLCAELEAKNEERLSHFRRLPPELLQKIVDEYLHQNDLVALAMTCRFFREKQKDLGKKVETDLTSDRLLEQRKSGKIPSHSLGWVQWVCDTFEILPGFIMPGWDDEDRVKGAVYEGELLNYAAFQGSVKIFRWLHEEKGCKLNQYRTGWWAGMGGSVEIFEYLKLKGYEFFDRVCEGAARGGRLKALKFLRSQDPPCPWSEQTCGHAAQGGSLEALKWLRDQDPPCPWDAMTCTSAAWGGNLEALEFLRDQDPPCPWDEETCQGAAMEGHLEVLQWLRGQDPPCPWDEVTCVWAARGGHLEVLKWARSQDPPCPWSRSHCRWEASESDHQHIVKWIDQQEDVSDVESSDSDSDSDRSYDSLGSEDF